MRPIENGYPAILWGPLMDTPEIVVGTLRFREGTPKPQTRIPGIDALEHTPDGPVLASGIHGLEHDQQLLLRLGPKPGCSWASSAFKGFSAALASTFSPSKPCFESGRECKVRFRSWRDQNGVVSSTRATLSNELLPSPACAWYLDRKRAWWGRYGSDTGDGAGLGEAAAVLVGAGLGARGGPTQVDSTVSTSEAVSPSAAVFPVYVSGWVATPGVVEMRDERGNRRRRHRRCGWRHGGALSTRSTLPGRWSKVTTCRFRGQASLFDRGRWRRRAGRRLDRAQSGRCLGSGGPSRRRTGAGRANRCPSGRPRAVRDGGGPPGGARHRRGQVGGDEGLDIRALISNRPPSPTVSRPWIGCAAWVMSLLGLDPRRAGVSSWRLFPFSGCRRGVGS